MSGPKHFFFFFFLLYSISLFEKSLETELEMFMFIFLRTLYSYFYRINELRLPMFVSKIYRDMDIIVVHYFGILVRRLPDICHFLAISQGNEVINSVPKGPY